MHGLARCRRMNSGVHPRGGRGAAANQAGDVRAVAKRVAGDTRFVRDEIHARDDAPVSAVCSAMPESTTAMPTPAPV